MSKGAEVLALKTNLSRASIADEPSFNQLGNRLEKKKRESKNAKDRVSAGPSSTIVIAF
jgi:hypothetical protein